MAPVRRGLFHVAASDCVVAGQASIAAAETAHVETSSAGNAAVTLTTALDRGAVRVNGAKDVVVVLMDIDHRPQ